jgi:hypothetical protein
LGEGGERLFKWFGDGDTPSRYYPDFRMSAASAAFFDEYAGQVGGERRRPAHLRRVRGLRWQRAAARCPAVRADPSSAGCRAGDPPYTFVTTGVEDAVAQARAAAGGRNVSLMGAQVVQHGLRAGLLDELTVSVVPVALGAGVRLLDGLPTGTGFELVRAVDTPGVLHLTYRVLRQPAGVAGAGPDAVPG